MKRLYVDIETSPLIAYTWRIGHNINLDHNNIIRDPSIICICYKWEDKEVEAMTWDREQCDRSMLERFVKVLMKADEVIAHNGDRFDLPWIRTRCAFHRIDIPAVLPSVDTLKQARRGFRFPSNRLDYLGKYMGLGRKVDTGGFGLWRDVMDGKRKALSDMVSYCKQDVQLLQEVHRSLYGYAKPTTHIGVMESGYKHHCPYCGNEETKSNGHKSVSAAGIRKIQVKCIGDSGCGKTWMMSEITYKAERLREERFRQNLGEP